MNSRIKTILISQPKPETEKSPYFDLAKKHSLKIIFQPFIHIEGVGAQEFRKIRLNLSEYNSVVLTSRNAIDHYFRICREMRVVVPDSVKYFCVSEAIAFYLQKYVIYRKRKIFYGKQKFSDLMGIINKHREDKFLLPCSDIVKPEISAHLVKNKIKFSKAMIYRTICNDLSALANINYDLLVFFSPSGIKSLFKNFPDFKQNNTKIAAFGTTTAQAVKDAGLNLDIAAPMPNAPSMTMAIEQYLKKVNVKK